MNHVPTCASENDTRRVRNTERTADPCPLIECRPICTAVFFKKALHKIAGSSSTSHEEVHHIITKLIPENGKDHWLTKACIRMFQFMKERERVLELTRGLKENFIENNWEKSFLSFSASNLKLHRKSESENRII